MACHGEAGEGNREFGGPRLTDPIWRSMATRPHRCPNQRPRMGVMPAWKGRLDENTIKQLAIYVHSLGGGENRPGPDVMVES